MTLDSQLRSLDVAEGQPDARRRARGASLVERIVHDESSTTSAARRRVVWRVAGVAAAGALLAAGGVLLPSALSPAQPAVASWTADPSAVSSADLQVAADACRASASPWPWSPAMRDASVLLAERRGDVVGVVLWQAEPERQTSCIVELPPGSSSATAVRSAESGQSGPALQAPAGAFAEGGIAQFAVDGGDVSMTSGSVGQGVVAVRLHADGITTEATVADGRYVAWWPGAALTSDDEPSGEGGPESIVRYDLVLADGSVVADATSVRPD